MTAPTACNHPDWEWTGGGFKCATTGCHGVRSATPADFAAGSTSPVGGSFTATVTLTPRPDWTLFPWVGAGRALEAIGYGANVKHSPGDWRTRYTRAELLGKVMRHLVADMSGVRINTADGGLLHVACAAADLLFLLELEPDGRNGT